MRVPQLIDFRLSSLFIVASTARRWTTRQRAVARSRHWVETQSWWWVWVGWCKIYQTRMWRPRRDNCASVLYYTVCCVLRYLTHARRDRRSSSSHFVFRITYAGTNLNKAGDNILEWFSTLACVKWLAQNKMAVITPEVLLMSVAV
jgi:hypothetical protein